MAIIEINGKKVEVESGSMIIEAADALGVQIPRFCYHKKLSIAANCRMCLVDVEKAPKALPACATPVTEGMKIWTHSPKAILAQKAVMEFLLINHPLDCPICDQGGECELQDLSMGFGTDRSEYTEGKRVVKDKNIGPLISTDMTRCILCTRCVRFGSEIAGFRELGDTGRGECSEIGTYIEQNVTSEVSANIIDLCPVGALTSKPYRFKARGFELIQTPSIAPHDCVGSNIFIHTRRNEVMRVVPHENESINEIWLSDRDRFSYEALESSERLLNPKIKQGGTWKTVSWMEALDHTATALQRVIANNGSEQLGALVSPNATVEECYLMQKFMRGLGTSNIDHRLRQQDFENQDYAALFPNLGVSINELEKQSVVLLVGSHIRKENPILGLKLRKMTLGNGKLLVINPMDCSFNCEVTEKSIVGGDLVRALSGVAKSLLNQSNSEFPKGILLPNLKGVTPTESDERMAEILLKNNQKGLILLGALSLSHPHATQLIALANLIKQLTGIQVGFLTEGANSAGAWLMGCVPHRLPGGKSLSKPGKTVNDMLNQPLQAYLLLNVEPELDCIQGRKAFKALKEAHCVVAITAFESPTLMEYADILLPMAPFSETPGTFVNGEGVWQSFKSIVSPKGESRPAWKILRVLGNLCQLEGFDHEFSEAVLLEARSTLTELNGLPDWEWWMPETFNSTQTQGNIIRLAPVPLYATDSLVRRSKPLQETMDAKKSAIVYLNGQLASHLNLNEKDNKVRVKNGNESVILFYELDESVPNGCIVLASGIPETVNLGNPYDTVEVSNA